MERIRPINLVFFIANINADPAIAVLSENPRSAGLTRERILEAAYKLFRRQDFHRVTMDEIAGSAKLTKRTLYHHFRSKDDLLADVLIAQDNLALQAFRTFRDRLSGSAEAIAEGLFRELAVWADRPRWVAPAARCGPTPASCPLTFKSGAKADIAGLRICADCVAKVILHC